MSVWQRGEFGLRPHVALSVRQNPFILYFFITRYLAETFYFLPKIQRGEKAIGGRSPTSNQINRIIQGGFKKRSLKDFLRFVTSFSGKKSLKVNPKQFKSFYFSGNSKRNERISITLPR
jgi:hypothetical protein